MSIDHASDQVHRQTAASVVKHVALGVVGLGCEDAMVHLLNLLYPNIFETSPHVIDRIIDAIAAIRLLVGSGIVMLERASDLVILGRWLAIPSGTVTALFSYPTYPRFCEPTSKISDVIVGRSTMR